MYYPPGDSAETCVESFLADFPHVRARSTYINTCSVNTVKPDGLINTLLDTETPIKLDELLPFERERVSENVKQDNYPRKSDVEPHIRQMAVDWNNHRAGQMVKINLEELYRARGRLNQFREIYRRLGKDVGNERWCIILKMFKDDKLRNGTLDLEKGITQPVVASIIFNHLDDWMDKLEAAEEAFDLSWSGSKKPHNDIQSQWTPKGKV